jgi:cell division protease FtsH
MTLLKIPYIIAAVIGLLVAVACLLILKTSSTSNHKASFFCTFKDIAGPIPIELKHLVSFIKDSDRLNRLGAHKPKGILLVGQPGTGKTLLVRALAGETNSHFLYVSGSDFIELYVGNGAKKVRELFQRARELLTDQKSWLDCLFRLRKTDQLPTQSVIIFIDEIDAIGNRNQECAEHRQTINQLLSCMDGFDQDEHITVIAATNTPEVLDKALKRSGRFDYIIEIPLPNQQTREDILRLYCNNTSISNTCNLETIAKKTKGFSGADLKLLSNEAALQAVLSKNDCINEEHFLMAFKKINNKKNQE